MKKRTVFLILIDLIFAACFNIVFFLNLKDPVAKTWISYGFINFAFVMSVISPLLIGKSKSPYLFTVVNTSISLIYFIVNVIIALCSIFIKVMSVKFLLTLYIILTAVYLITFILLLVIGEKDK